MGILSKILLSTNKIYAAGILCFAKDTKKFLIVKRAEGSPEPNTWCGVGGKAETSDNTFKQTALREFEEEVGYPGPFNKLKLLYIVENTKLKFYNYIGIIHTEFTPKLDTSENTEYKWVTKDELINHENLHKGFNEFLNFMF